MSKRMMRMGVIVVGLVVAVGLCFPASASADPPGLGAQGGAHTNRYHAQACQQGEHQVRVETATKNAFRNAGDCTSHTALGGTLGAAANQIILSSSPLYACAAPFTGACWGDLSMAIPTGDFALILATTSTFQLRINPDANGDYNGPANIPCSESNTQGIQFYAFAPGVGSSGNVTPPDCN
jgi:hypothetical protein